MKKIFIAFFILLVCALVTSCSKESETFNTATLDDYYPLKAGKIFLYRLDSTVLGSFGSSMIVKSYTAKDSVE
ncbi:MAG: hypothetical protein M3040_04750, partial [Bacteroidota bacterium]|nr:hypothetical protein [Bacteroidota bacterium]